MKVDAKPDKRTRNFNLYEDGIKKNPLYKLRGMGRTDEARKIIIEKCPSVKTIVPGQMVMFHYYEPITKDELAYYDAGPCVIYFGVHQMKPGLRVFGFNLHYYPPKMRFRLMTQIFKLFQPIFMKYWETGVTKELDAFDYKFLVDTLERYNLAFGVRQYDPSLMSEKRLVSPEWFSTAMFTEGMFRKQTRTQIMNYWKSWKPTNAK